MYKRQPKEEYAANEWFATSSEDTEVKGIYTFSLDWSKASQPTVTVTPVSYTHLDVYKRQVDVLDSNQYRQRITDLYGENSDAYRAMGTANTDWQDLMYRTALSHDHNITAVSYTHLRYKLNLRDSRLLGDYFQSWSNLTPHYHL